MLFKESKLARVILPILLGLLSSIAAGKGPLQTAINGPFQLAIDSHGNLYVSEEYGHRVVHIDWEQNEVTVVAGNGKECCFIENAQALRSSIYHVYAMALDTNDNLYLGGRNADDGPFVRVVDRNSRRIRSLAKGQTPVSLHAIPALEAKIFNPHGIAALPNGTLLVSADVDEEIVEINNSAVTFAGVLDQKGFAGDGGPAREALFSLPSALALDSYGNLFVADYFNHRIRRIDGKSKLITTVAGNGMEESSGDGGPATKAGVSYPFDVALDGEGNVYFIENGVSTVRRIDTRTGTVVKIAGTGKEGYSGDGGLALDAEINAAGLAVDKAGNIYISDPNRNRIRRIDAQSGIITTVAGNGLPKRKVVNL